MHKEIKGYKVRPIMKSDDPLIAAIIRTNLEKFHLDIPGTVYFDPELDHLSAFYHAEPEKREYFIVVDDEEQVIGGVGIAEFGGFVCCAELQKIYLTDAAKGKGLGKYLLQLAEDFARNIGYQRLYLETHTNLETAIHMYENHGFCQIEKPKTVLHHTMNQFYIKELV